MRRYFTRKIITYVVAFFLATTIDWAIRTLHAHRVRVMIDGSNAPDLPYKFGVGKRICGVRRASITATQYRTENQRCLRSHFKGP